MGLCGSKSPMMVPVPLPDDSVSIAFFGTENMFRCIEYLKQVVDGGGEGMEAIRAAPSYALVTSARNSAERDAEAAARQAQDGVGAEEMKEPAADDSSNGTGAIVRVVTDHVDEIQQVYSVLALYIARNPNRLAAVRQGRLPPDRDGEGRLLENKRREAACVVAHRNVLLQAAAARKIRFTQPLLIDVINLRLKRKLETKRIEGLARLFISLDTSGSGRLRAADLARWLGDNGDREPSSGNPGDADNRRALPTRSALFPLITLASPTPRRGELDVADFVVVMDAFLCLTEEQVPNFVFAHISTAERLQATAVKRERRISSMAMSVDSVGASAVEPIPLSPGESDEESLSDADGAVPRTFTPNSTGPASRAGGRAYAPRRAAGMLNADMRKPSFLLSPEAAAALAAKHAEEHAEEASRRKLSAATSDEDEDEAGDDSLSQITEDGSRSEGASRLSASIRSRKSRGSTGRSHALSLDPDHIPPDERISFDFFRRVLTGDYDVASGSPTVPHGGGAAARHPSDAALLTAIEALARGGGDSSDGSPTPDDVRSSRKSGALGVSIADMWQIVKRLPTVLQPLLGAQAAMRRRAPGGAAYWAARSEATAYEAAMRRTLNGSLSAGEYAVAVATPADTGIHLAGHASTGSARLDGDDDGGGATMRRPQRHSMVILAAEEGAPALPEVKEGDEGEEEDVPGAVAS